MKWVVIVMMILYDVVLGGIEVGGAGGDEVGGDSDNDSVRCGFRWG